MRLVTYETDGGELRCGLPLRESVFAAGDLARAVGLNPEGAAACETSRGVLGLNRSCWAWLWEAARAGACDPVADLSAVRLAAPIPDPQKIICMGLNYRDHAEEAGMEIPTTPVVFAKYPNSLIGPADPIVLPAHHRRVDYEAELAVVIGRRCRNVSEAEAIDVIAGAMAFNDVSERDLQMRTSQWMLGKAIDTFAPCGPWLVSLDELAPVDSIRLLARLNGETVQDSTTGAMIFGVAEVIAFLTQLMTLEPGDIIATGTPAGVGFARDPPLILRAGDVIEIEVEGIGSLRNPVIASSGADATAAETAPATANPS